MSADLQRITHAVDAIEREMKRAGAWEATSLPAEKYAFTQAFAMDTMAFTQWLQFVFLVRVRSPIAAGGPFPESSQVAVQATREFRGISEAAELCSELSAFDALFDNAS